MNLPVSFPSGCVQLGQRLMAGRYRTHYSPGTDSASPPVAVSITPADLLDILPHKAQVEVSVQAIRLLGGSQDASELAFSTIEIAAPSFYINQNPPFLNQASIQQCDPWCQLSSHSLLFVWAVVFVRVLCPTLVYQHLQQVGQHYAAV